MGYTMRRSSQVKVLANGMTVSALSGKTIDGGLVAALLAPTLDAYVARRGLGGGGE
jgi:hypothetical protein